jgi:outer membrane protein OmpA-like peptidoglycan-associated protein/Mg-chelatase subunit ChlD
MLPVLAGNKYIKYKFDKSKVAYGDSIVLSWEAPKKYEVRITGIDSVFNFEGQVKIPSGDKERITITATKGKKTLTRRTRAMKVVFPEFHYFTAQRNPSNPGEIAILWNTENYKSISIERVGEGLPASGKAIVQESGPVRLALRAKNYMNEVYVRYVDIPKDYSINRNYIKEWSSIEANDSTPVYMEIIAVNISGYPDEVELKVLVYDTLGNFITGLAPPFNSDGHAKQFFKRVFVTSQFGEKPVHFKVREMREVSRDKADISFVMDHSGSMNDVIVDFKLAAARFAAHKNHEDRMSLVVFDHRIYMLNELTSDSNALVGHIDNNNYLLGGSTALYAACDEGLESIRYSVRDKYLVVFTDGRENASFPYNGFRATDANRLSNKIRELNAKLFVVGYGNHVNYEVLEQLCKLSNGKFYYISDFDELEEVLTEINMLINGHYSITFSPPKAIGPADIKLIYQNFESDLMLEESYFIGEVAQIEEKETGFTYHTPKDSIKLLFPPQVIANFQFNKAFIEDQFSQPLNNFSQYLVKNPEVNVLIAGHSDSRGKEYQRQRISKKRAEMVADFFINKGIDSQRIRTEYYSFSKPLHQNEAHDWQARENRRVEIILYTRN